MLTKTEPRFNNDTAGNMRRIVQYAELAGWRWSQADNEQVYVLAPRELRDDIPVMAMKLSAGDMHDGMEWWGWICSTLADSELDPADTVITEAFCNDQPATDIYPEAADAILRELSHQQGADLHWALLGMPRNENLPVTLSDLPEELQRGLIGETLWVDAAHVTGEKILAMFGGSRAVVLDTEYSESDEVSTDQVFLTR